MGNEHTVDKHQAGPDVGSPSSFADLGLSDRALAAIAHAGFDTPTEIQKIFIPAAVTGRDCIGRARTGTGKTAAFLLPIFEHFFAHENISALILAPTRELARQICEESDKLAGKLPPRALPVYGGQPMKRQIERLRSKPEIVVATPGRIMDHGRRGTVSFNRFSLVVCDEVDRMFDMGFRKDIGEILRKCSNRQQSLFLSATLPEPIMRLAERYTDNPLRLNAVENDRPAVESLDQRYFSVAPNRKQSLVVELIEREQPELCLVFTRTKIGADRLFRELEKRKLSVRHMHGDLPQRKRESALREFKTKKINILVATDIVGRGIDVPGVSLVINYDLPENPEDYLHRIGRSARMNTPGKAFSFVTPDDGNSLTEIEILCNELMQQDSIEGFDTGIKKRGR